MDDKLMYTPNCDEENNYFKNFNYWLKSPSIRMSVRPGQLVLTVPSISNFA